MRLKRSSSTAATSLPSTSNAAADSWYTQLIPRTFATYPTPSVPDISAGGYGAKATADPTIHVVVIRATRAVQSLELSRVETTGVNGTSRPKMALRCRGGRVRFRLK